MIKSFAHKGLEKFYLTGSTAGIQFKHAEKLQLILQLLNKAEKPEHMNFDGSRLHPLKGKLKGFWSVKVSGNWRVIFKITEDGAEIVNYIDYH